MQKPTVLVVDDNEGILELVGAMLATNGYEPNFALTAQYAFDRIVCGGIAAVIIDANLPGITGADLLRHIRDAQLTLPVVVMASGRSEELKKIGADLVIPKAEVAVRFEELVVPHLGR